jgi:hypothetical protein
MAIGSVFPGFARLRQRRIDAPSQETCSIAKEVGLVIMANAAGLSVAKTHFSRPPGCQMRAAAYLRNLILVNLLVMPSILFVMLCSAVGTPSTDATGAGTVAERKVLRVMLQLSEFGDGKIRIEKTSLPPADDSSGTPFKFSNWPRAEATKGKEGMFRLIHDFSDCTGAYPCSRLTIEA